MKKAILTGVTGPDRAYERLKEGEFRAASHTSFTTLGVLFTLVDYPAVLSAINIWRKNGLHNYICLVPPNSVMICRRDSAMKSALLGAAMILPDGIGVIIAAQLHGIPHSGRVSGPTLMLRMCDEGREHGLRHFFFGGDEEGLHELTARLGERFRGLSIAGQFSPPFREQTAEEQWQAIEFINSTRPDIVWVGLGAPKQEKWMAKHRAAVKCTALIGVGAAFDFHSGKVPWAPAVVRKLGLEWIHRFLMEPGRMWKRDIESGKFILFSLFELLQRKGSENI